MGDQPKILTIGPVTNEKDGLIGGATISFGQLVDFLGKHGVLKGVVNTQTYHEGLQKIWNIPYILFRLLVELPGASLVMLNTSRGGTRFLAPVVFVLAKLFQKPFVFRPFGGDIKDYTATYNKWQQWIFRHTILFADLLLLQTRELMAYYADSGVRTMHFPTSRKSPPEELLKMDRPFQKRFVFLGHIKASKGIEVILEAAQKLSGDYIIDLYGPITEEKYFDRFVGSQVKYKGVLPHQDILKTLARYDVLILPTFYEGEGYPGVIIEAFSLGLPVITTHWKAIPELVEDSVNGLLIPPQSAEALFGAMMYFNEQNYTAFSNKAHLFFKTYLEENVVLGHTLNVLEQLQKSIV